MEILKVIYRLLLYVYLTRNNIKSMHWFIYTKGYKNVGNFISVGSPPLQTDQAAPVGASSIILTITLATCSTLKQVTIKELHCPIAFNNTIDYTAQVVELP